MGYLLFDYVVPATLLTVAAMGAAGAVAVLVDRLIGRRGRRRP